MRLNGYSCYGSDVRSRLRNSSKCMKKREICEKEIR
nr:hypothetical protein REQ54_04754 [Rhizobium sp. Q54]